jgi:hypothetical protein
MRRGSGFLLLVILATACFSTEQRMTGPGNQQTLEPIRLSEAQRSSIATQWDADAVEKIANLLNGEDRRSFMHPLGGVPGDTLLKDRGQHGNYYFMLTHPDPRIQDLLHQMWAPFWETLPPEALTSESPAYKFPGRAIALERRAARLKAGMPK